MVNEVIFFIHFSAMDFDGESLWFEFGWEVEPGDNNNGSYDHEFFFLALISFAFVFAHEVKDYSHMAPVGDHVHPVLIALEFVLDNFDVELVFG